MVPKRGVLDTKLRLDCPGCGIAFTVVARELFDRDLHCPACGEFLQLTTDQRRILWFAHVKAFGQAISSSAEQD